MPIKSKYPPLPIPKSVDYWNYMLIKIAPFYDRPCLTDGVTGRTLTFANFVAMVNKARRTLWAKGLRKGDVFMSLTPNCIEAPVVMCACLSIGVIYSSCNPALLAEEIEFQIKESGVRCFAVAPMLVDLLKKALKEIPPKLVITYGDGSTNETNSITFADLLSVDSPEVPFIAFEPKKDIAFMLFSSGTTGKPKGVLISHYANVANNVTLSGKLTYYPNTQPDSLVLFLPFYHIYGQLLFTHSLVHGKRIVMVPKFHTKLYLDLITKYQTPMITLVPPVALILAKDPIVDKYDLSFLKNVVSGAATLPHSVATALKKRIPTVLVTQAMGMTESGCCLITPYVEAPLGTSGLLVPNMEAKIIDIGTGKELGPNKEGEICFRGPSCMIGYLNNKEATKQALSEDGWLSTGDIGYYDNDGYFFITDRLKEVIKCKGFQVVPSLLESILLEHEAVADTAVIGIPDEYAGEVPKAFVVLKPNKTISADQLKEFVAKRVAPYKRLSGGVEFVDTIPKTPSGKILRRNLKSNL